MAELRSAAIRVDRAPGRTGYFPRKTRAIWSRRGLVSCNVPPLAGTVEMKAAPREINYLDLGLTIGEREPD